MKKNIQHQPKQSTSKNDPTLSPKAARTPNTRSARLELIEFATTNTRIVKENDAVKWMSAFGKNAATTGIKLKNEIGSFELTFEFGPDTTLLTLIRQNEPTKLTAHLVTDPQHLSGVRTELNLQRAKRWPIEKVNRTSAMVPCLIVNLQNAPATYTEKEREILFSIFADAAFGLMKFFRKRNRRHKFAGKRPLFTAGSAQ
jgi:hypothetical protein